MSASLAARCWQLHRAAERGDPAAERKLERLAAGGVRAGQCLIDLTMGWHRHPGSPDPCEDPCAEASDPAVWAASWEAYWPPGQHPGSVVDPGGKSLPPGGEFLPPGSTTEPGKPSQASR